MTDFLSFLPSSRATRTAPSAASEPSTPQTIKPVVAVASPRRAAASPGLVTLAIAPPFFVVLAGFPAARGAAIGRRPDLSHAHGETHVPPAPGRFPRAAAG
jgi:hypothetical protein